MGSVCSSSFVLVQEDAQSVSRIQTADTTSALSRWFSSVIDGRSRWGSYTISVGRYGSVNHWLVVYPPGISRQQRRRVRVWRSWFGVGIAGSLGVFAVLAWYHTPTMIIVLACTSFYALGAVAVAHYAGTIRRRVIELRAGWSTLVPDPQGVVQCEYLARLAAVLSAAERSLDEGTSTPAAHEVVWAAVYDEAQSHVRKAGVH